MKFIHCLIVGVLVTLAIKFVGFAALCGALWVLAKISLRTLLFAAPALIVAGFLYVATTPWRPVTQPVRR